MYNIVERVGVPILGNTGVVKKKKLSTISRTHYIKLCYRSLLFLGALGLYIYDKVACIDRNYYKSWFIWLVWLVLMVEMVSRLFPSKFESMGCQKQFKRNFKPTKLEKSNKVKPKRIAAVTAAWLGLNGLIGALYLLKLMDAEVLFIIGLAYSVCDIICILFFCPFQTWFMKNRCCATCRIYNWDFAMMCTPFIFIPHFFTWSLLAVSLVILLRWEVMAHKRPQMVYEDTNACLSCANCKEKLCDHKKQLQSYLKNYKG